MQKEIAKKFIQELNREEIYPAPIATEVKLLEKFFVAEDYHHNCFGKNPAAAYCQAIINPKLKKMREKFKDILK